MTYAFFCLQAKVPPWFQSRRTVLGADIWISETDLDYTPTAIYENSPMYPRDRRLESLIAITRSPVGTQAGLSVSDSRREPEALWVFARIECHGMWRPMGPGSRGAESCQMVRWWPMCSLSARREAKMRVFSASSERS